MTVVLKIENLWKEYRLGVFGHGMLFRDLQSWWARARGREDPNTPVGRASDNNGRNDRIWALRDVSVEVEEGEVLGIIGRNGAGKSTLLKILSRVTAPTKGSVKIRGRVASLLEVGTGFHPELTGRENTFLNGAILGMTRAEIRRKFDEIIDFAGIEKFIDTPVKRYSSGMYVRLAFAVAAHLDPEILVVDEVLAVGDAEFQKKCLGKMGEVAKGGRTVLFVSHNMVAVQALCIQAIVLDRGVIRLSGPSPEVVSSYVGQIQTVASSVPLKQRKDRSGDGRIRITVIRFGTTANPKTGMWWSGQDAVIEVYYEGLPSRTFSAIEMAIGIKKLDQTPLLYLGTKVVKQDLERFEGVGSSVCKIRRLPLEPGPYVIDLEIKERGVIVDHIPSAAAVEVADGDYYGTGARWSYGGLLADYSWRHTAGEKKCFS